MNRAIFARTLAGQRTKLLVVALGLVVWGSLLPPIYVSFRETIQEVLSSGGLAAQFAQFGGGDLFSLQGTIALGFIHPIPVALTIVFAVGFATASVAGERQRGTLEVLLARPVSRRRLYATLLGATWLFTAIVMAAHVLGTILGSVLAGVAAELHPDRLALMWLNGVVVFGAYGAISLAASVSFDRLSPALGVSLTFVLVTYLFEVLGSLWVDAKGLQPWSLFHYLDPKGALTGTLTALDWLVPLGVVVAAAAWALVVFPRRDLAAPS